MKPARLITFLFVSGQAFSQTGIVLNTVPFDTNDSSVHIHEVIDVRADKILGYKENKNRTKDTLILYGGASSAIKQFMNTSFSPAPWKKPICINVKVLEVDQAQTSITELTSRVYMELTFLEKQEQGFKVLYNIRHHDDQAFPLSGRAESFETHEKRIRAGLEYCMRNFIHAKENGFQPLPIDSLGGNKENASIPDNPKLRRWFNLLTIKKIRSRYNQGWTVSYIGFADDNKDFISPFVISYGQSKVRSGTIPDKYSAINTYALSTGFNGLLKIASGVYANIGLEIPVGIEALEDKQSRKTNNFLIGINTRQGIRIISLRDFGVVIGATFFQQIQTSKINKANLGFELELGINF